MNEDKQLKKLEKVIELLKLNSEEYVSIGDFAESLKLILEFVNSKNTKSNREREGLINDFNQFQEKVLREHQGINSSINYKESGLRRELGDLLIRLEELENAPIAEPIKGEPGTPGKDGSPDSSEEIIEKLEILVGDERLNRQAIFGLDGLPSEKEWADIKRIVLENANQGNGALPPTTTFFSKNGQVIGRAKNINFIEGNNTTLNVYQSGDQMNVSITSTGGGSGTQVTEEIPTGTIDGNNTAFTLAHTPLAGTLKVYLNGARQQSGGGDYTLSGSTITFVTTPLSSSILFVDYSY